MTLATTDAPQAANGNNLPAKRVVEFQPLAPVGNAGALKGLLESQRNGIAMALPRHVTPERLIKTLLVAANRTPDLLQCTQASILETINRAAELGLDLSGTLGEAYPVPFNNKVKTPNGEEIWAKQCQLIIGYRGLAKLARQSGEVKRIDADVVCENDDFTFRKGSDARCEFIPNLRGDRGKPVGAYAYVQFRDGGEQFDFMPYEDIEKVRRCSKSGSDKQGNAIGVWRNHWPEMAKKTVFRRVAKWLPLSTEKLVAAMEQDDADYGLADVLSAEAGHAKPKGAAALLDKLKTGNQIAAPQVSSEALSQQAHPFVDEPQQSNVEEGQGEPQHEESQEQQTGAIPPHGRTSAAWIDDLVTVHKPAHLSAHAARTAFHAKHKPSSWQNVPPAEQDALHQALIGGQVEWPEAK